LAAEVSPAGEKPGVKQQRNAPTVSVALAIIAVLGSLSCLSCCRMRKRPLELADFDRLELGMSLEEITCRLGRPPDTRAGSRIRHFECDLADGRTVALQFMSPGLTDARVYDQDGTWTDLIEQGD
jgi:hypothetical protein